MTSEMDGLLRGFTLKTVKQLTEVFEWKLASRSEILLLSRACPQFIKYFMPLGVHVKIGCIIKTFGGIGNFWI